MLRTILYLLAGLALFALGFFALAMIVVASNGVAAVRGDLFGHIGTAYTVLGLPSAIAGALWLARRRRS